jgi:transcriptional regulator with XRE-family HTH domain
LNNLIYPNINAERSRNGLTNEELAARLGVTRKTLYSWMERGNIPQSKLELMANLFHCSIDYLLERPAKFCQEGKAKN